MIWVFGQAQGAWSGPLLWSGWLSGSSTATPHRFIQVHKLEYQILYVLYLFFRNKLGKKHTTTFLVCNFYKDEKLIANKKGMGNGRKPNLQTIHSSRIISY